MLLYIKQSRGAIASTTPVNVHENENENQNQKKTKKTTDASLFVFTHHCLSSRIPFLNRSRRQWAFANWPKARTTCRRPALRCMAIMPLDNLRIVQYSAAIRSNDRRSRCMWVYRRSLAKTSRSTRSRWWWTATVCFRHRLRSFGRYSCRLIDCTAAIFSSSTCRKAEYKRRRRSALAAFLTSLWGTGAAGELELLEVFVWYCCVRRRRCCCCCSSSSCSSSRSRCWSRRM